MDSGLSTNTSPALTAPLSPSLIHPPAHLKLLLGWEFKTEIPISLYPPSLPSISAALPSTPLLFPPFQLLSPKPRHHLMFTVCPPPAPNWQVLWALSPKHIPKYASSYVPIPKFLFQVNSLNASSIPAHSAARGVF